MAIPDLEWGLHHIFKDFEKVLLRHGLAVNGWEKKLDFSPFGILTLACQQVQKPAVWTSDQARLPVLPDLQDGASL
ncbi:hypothetical protein [Hydrogenophaga sp.]|uniref:hypothetical protein n=1 Tax=Hydrogenophaga sp. TaxID=1904254 RepID=UPI0035B3FF31